MPKERSKNMKHEQFWNIIEKGRKTQNCEELNDIVQKELEKLSLEELVSYHKLFHEFYSALYTWDIWHGAYIILGGCGDDCFMDFRGSIISLGRETYENTMLNPDWLINLDETALSEKLYNAEFQGLAPFVYEEKTSKDIYAEYRFQMEPHKPIGEKIDIESEDIEEIFMKKYPNLMKRYW